MSLEVGASDHLSILGRRLVLPSGMTVSEAAPGGGDVTLASGGSRSYVPLDRLTQIGWDSVNFPFSVTEVDDIFGWPRSVGTISKTPEQLFDAASTARSAPGATYFVSSTGNDANNGLTVGTPYKSIWKAIQSANAGGLPTTIFCAAGTYFRGFQPWASGILPTVDIALIATGGRVITGTFDNFTAPALDGTLTNCYAITVANVQRIADILNLDRFGNYGELVKIPGTAAGVGALCNATPNSWFLGTGTNGGTSGVLYINRADKQPVTVANTRLYRPQTGCLIVTTPINLYIGGALAGDGFDMEGNSDTGGGTLGILTSTPGSTRHVLVARDSSFCYGGGSTDTVNNGVSVNSWKGLAAFFNCQADANMNDGFNFHNSNAAVGMYVLTVNCTGNNNGRNANQSDNGWTSHEDVVGVDVCSFFEGNHGGSVRSINTSKSWLVGTSVKDDLGDLCYGGSTKPTAFRVDDTAVFYCEGTKVNMWAAGYGYVAGTTGSAIHKRGAAPCPLPDYAVSGATIDTY